MSLVRNAYAVPLLLTALAVLVLGVAAWLQRRRARGGAALAALSVAAAAWAACAAAWLAVGTGSAGAAWLAAQRAAEAFTVLGMLTYALRATRSAGRATPYLLWGAAGVAAAAAALAFGPVGGLSYWRAVLPGAAWGRPVTLGVPSAWGLAAAAILDLLAAGALAALALAWLRSKGDVAARHGWTLLGIAMPVLVELVAALAAGRAPAAGAAGADAAAAVGLSPGVFLLGPAALAAAQGLLGGGRGLALAGEDDGRGAAADGGARAASGAAPRELLDHLDQAVLLIGPGGQVSYANAAAARLFRRAEGLRGASASAVFADVPALGAALARRRRAVLEVELGGRAAGRAYEAWLTPLAERHGRFAGTMVAFVDAGARRQAESEGASASVELRRSEALLEALQEALRGALRGEPLGLLLDIVVTGCARVTDAPHVALYLEGGAADALTRRAAVGAFEAGDAPPVRREEGLAGRVWASGKVEAAEGLPDRDGTAVGGGSGGDAAGGAGTGTAVGVPVRQGGKPVGVLLAARKRGDWRAFPAAEVRFLERFADLAGVAVREAAARDRAARAELELAWLDRIDALIARDAPDTEVLDAALRAAGEAAGFDRAVVWLASAAGDELEARAWLGFSPGPEGSERWPLNGSVPLLEEAYRSGREIVLTGGGPLPARFRPSGSAEGAPLLRATRPVVLPLPGGDRLLGVLAADDSREGVDLRPRLEALRRIAARVAQALERGRLRADTECLRDRAEDAEQRLRATAARREALIEALPAAYFETDLRGVVTRASRELARLSEAAAEGLKGVRLADLSAPGRERTVPDAMGRVLRSGRPVRAADWALRRRDGELLPVKLSLSVLRGEDGAAAGYFGVVVAREE